MFLMKVYALYLVHIDLICRGWNKGRTKRYLGFDISLSIMEVHLY